MALTPSDWTLIAIAPIVGSFLGVLIVRLPQGAPIAVARSRCDACGTKLAVRDLIPFVSWLLLRGRCRSCGQPLGWFYPAVEGAALVIAMASLAVDRGGEAWINALLGWMLLTLAWIDVRHLLLPDRLTLPLAAIGLAESWLLARDELIDRAVGVAAGYVCLWVVAYGYRRLRGRDGLGLGDAKLVAAGGAWVGASGLPSVIAGGAIAALLTVGVLSLRGVRFRSGHELPFGPFLALAIWLVWLFGSFS
jgi:leader peptidase (prepilin peptidase)/N-methyltransferase